MPFDVNELKLEREKRCLAFCSVLREAHLVSSDLSSLLGNTAPPASQSSIAAVRATQTSVKAISLPTENVKLICDFAFAHSDADDLLRKCVAEQIKYYSRLPGKIVFQGPARVGERVRESKYKRIGQGNINRGNMKRGAIISKDGDDWTEIAVRWDDGTVDGNEMVGLKCGKKGFYALVYD